MKFKVYPNKKSLQDKSRAACRAINKLTKLGIEVLNIDLCKSNPLISVSHCPGTRKIHSVQMGRGVSHDTGKGYITRNSFFNQCVITWNEEV